MSKLTIITDRALELVSQAGSNLKQAMPKNADKLLQTGVVLGAAKTGAKTAGKFIRRNPVVAVAAAAGIGLLAYAAYRKRKRDAADAPIEGKSRRIEARKVNGTGRAGRRAAARSTTSPNP
ncbi:hypothetical protein ACTJI2_15800 [Pseudoxanthomonas sp. 22568]|uniref:hypothetical protein n=1 Tax=Pseudoxanthomonas sp. 22568 TaxID=3453945 RepID=UPI003F8357D6